MTLDFYANETIEIIGGLPSSFGQANQIFLRRDNVEVDSDGFPGTLSYQFPANAYAKIEWEVPGDNVTWTVECLAGDAATMPVPTLNWLGITLMASLLAGFAYYHRRRFFA